MTSMCILNHMIKKFSVLFAEYLQLPFFFIDPDLCDGSHCGGINVH